MTENQELNEFLREINQELKKRAEINVSKNFWGESENFKDKLYRKYRKTLIKKLGDWAEGKKVEN